MIDHAFKIRIVNIQEVQINTTLKAKLLDHLTNEFHVSIKSILVSNKE